MFNWIKKIKWFIQRGKRGWADCDAWSFDGYLCDIIIAGVSHLQKNMQGCPSELYDESSTNNECWKWKEKLEEIIQGFEAGKQLMNHNFMRWDEREEDDLLEWNMDTEKRDQLSRKYKRGITVFSEYFLNLWD